MSMNKKINRRISALMVVFALLSMFLFTTMVFGDEVTTASTEATETTTASYEYEEIEDDSGLIKSILRFFGKILSFCNDLTDNYIFALFLFSLIMQLALCFVGVKQQKNSVRQAQLAPKVAAINKKYAGRNDQVTLQKRQQETMELYQKEGYSPYGGCLPLLIQFPIIMILYYVVIAPIEYILNLSSSVANNLQYMLSAFDASFATTGRAVQMNTINWFRTNRADGIERLRTWIDTVVAGVNSDAAANYKEALAAIEGKLDVLPNFKIGDLDLAEIPSLTGNGNDLSKWLLVLIPVLTFVFLIITQKLTKKFSYQSPETVEASNKMSMKIMSWSMPLLSAYFTFVVPAAIGVYWIFRNILNLVQQIILAKLIPIPKFTQEEYKAAEREIMGSSSRKKDRIASRSNDPNRPKVRSLHHIDDEGYENGYKIDPNAPADTKATVTTPTTETESAPAPIKNDEKTSYSVRSSDDDTKE